MRFLRVIPLAFVLLASAPFAVAWAQEAGKTAPQASPPASSATEAPAAEQSGGPLPPWDYTKTPSYPGKRVMGPKAKKHRWISPVLSAELDGAPISCKQLDQTIRKDEKDLRRLRRMIGSTKSKIFVPLGCRFRHGDGTLRAFGDDMDACEAYVRKHLPKHAPSIWRDNRKTHQPEIFIFEDRGGYQRRLAMRLGEAEATKRFARRQAEHDALVAYVKGTKRDTFADRLRDLYEEWADNCQK